jgi:hypothetical protein
MRELLDNETRKEPYFRQLRERIRSEGLKLVNEVSYLRTISDSCEGKKLCDPDAHPMVCVSLLHFLVETSMYRSLDWFITGTATRRN